MLQSVTRGVGVASRKFGRRNGLEFLPLGSHSVCLLNYGFLKMVLKGWL
jgi:hypothetical protein